MEKQLVLYIVLLFFPIKLESLSHSEMHEMLSGPSFSSALQDPKIFLLVGAGLLLCARIAWWTFDARNKPKTHSINEQDENQSRRMGTLANSFSTSDERVEQRLSHMHLMSTMNTTGLSLVQQMDLKFNQLHGTIKNTLKQVINKKNEPTHQKLDEILAETKMLRSEMQVLKKDVQILKTTLSLSPPSAENT